jgi:hypothetical protein
MLINIRISELVSDTRNSIPLVVIITLIFQSANFVLPENYIYENNLVNNQINNTMYTNWENALATMEHIASIGNILYTVLAILLLLVSMILLLAMVGAIVITIKPKNSIYESKNVDPLQSKLNFSYLWKRICRIFFIGTIMWSLRYCLISIFGFNIAYFTDYLTLSYLTFIIETLFSIFKGDQYIFISGMAEDKTSIKNNIRLSNAIFSTGNPSDNNNLPESSSSNNNLPDTRVDFQRSTTIEEDARSIERYSEIIQENKAIVRKIREGHTTDSEGNPLPTKEEAKRRIKHSEWELRRMTLSEQVRRIARDKGTSAASWNLRDMLTVHQFRSTMVNPYDPIASSSDDSDNGSNNTNNGSNNNTNDSNNTNNGSNSNTNGSNNDNNTGNSN